MGNDFLKIESLFCSPKFVPSDFQSLTTAAFHVSGVIDVLR